MGVSLVTMFDPDLPDADSFAKGTDGNRLVPFVSTLDKIATAKGLALFSRFIPDLDEIDWDELDLDGADAGEVPEIWSDPAEGLRLISILADAIGSEKRWSKGWPAEWVREVVRDLGLLAKDLEVAKQSGARFSLAYA